MGHGRTYAEIVKAKIQNPRERKSMREVGRDVGYSYEHVRKVCAGELTFTREFSDALCKALGLDADEMWQLAQTEKLKKKFEGAEGYPASIPKDERVQEIWASLDSFGRECWIRCGRDLIAVAERASRHLQRA